MPRPSLFPLLAATFAIGGCASDPTEVQAGGMGTRAEADAKDLRSR